MSMDVRINEIPNEGWNYPPSRLSYIKIATDLQSVGLSEEVVADILTTCYLAAVDDYKYSKL